MAMLPQTRRCPVAVSKLCVLFSNKSCSYGEPVIHFDKKAEARLRLKIDLYIIPTVALLYLFCFIDRANIGNARLAGLEKDLHLKGHDYNSVLSVFYISYIIFEIPSNMACKWMGPGWCAYYLCKSALGAKY